jgi:hypothetical protein
MRKMFPLNYCGAWCLVYSTNIDIPASTLLNIQYNRVEVTPIKDFTLFQLKRTHQGVIQIRNDTVAKVVWSKKVDYHIDTACLPLIPFTGKEMNCMPLMLRYSIDETNTYCTFETEHHEYVFHRYIPFEKRDTIVRIFMTQLLFDFIIRHI